MLNSITKPLTAATGGIIPPFCPIKPSEEDLKKPGAEGAAAQALKDAVEASARRKAVRILGTFDCHWYPEAEAGLAMALRTDRAECVRLEAAIALNRGCCCTKLIVAALEDCVSGMDKLGPSENSPRVQAIAAMALDRCLQCPEATLVEEDVIPDGGGKEPGGEGPKPVEPGTAKPLVPPPTIPPPGNPSFGPSAKKGSGRPSRAQIEHARHTLAMAQARLQGVKPTMTEGSLPPGRRSLAGLAEYVISGSPASAPQTSTPPHASATNVQPIARTPAPARQLPPVENAKPISTYNAQPAPPAQVVMQPITKVEPPKPALDPTVKRCLETLHDATNPEVRHAALRTLTSCDWHEHPEALAGLLYVARSDNHAGMRVAAIRALVTVKAATPEVMTGLKPLTSDSDEWIRQEATRALTQLKAHLPPQTAKAGD